MTSYTHTAWVIRKNPSNNKRTNLVPLENCVPSRKSCGLSQGWADVLLFSPGPRLSLGGDSLSHPPLGAASFPNSYKDAAPGPHLLQSVWRPSWRNKAELQMQSNNRNLFCENIYKSGPKCANLKNDSSVLVDSPSLLTHR